MDFFHSDPKIKSVRDTPRWCDYRTCQAEHLSGQRTVRVLGSRPLVLRLAHAQNVMVEHLKRQDYGSSAGHTFAVLILLGVENTLDS